MKRLLLLIGALALSLAPQGAVLAEETTHWHAPTLHEHGDPEPEWVTKVCQTAWAQQYFGCDATGHVAYDVAFNTSPKENAADGKHFAMKGFHLSYNADPAKGFHGLKGEWLDGYARVHLSGTPVDRGAVKHSAAVFIAGFDRNGQPNLLAIRQGWLNTGSADTARVPNFCPDTPSTRPEVQAACAGLNPAQRPIVKVVTADSLTGKMSTNGQPNFQEQWYPEGVGFSWAWGISDAPTMQRMGERVDDYDIARWGLITGYNGQPSVGLLRQLDLTSRAYPVQNTLFWTNEDGEYVASPDSAECLSPHICLLQFYNDFPGITGRSPVIDFPGRGQVQAPKN